MLRWLSLKTSCVAYSEEICSAKSIRYDNTLYSYLFIYLFTFSTLGEGGEPLCTPEPDLPLVSNLTLALWRMRERELCLFKEGHYQSRINSGRSTAMTDRL